MIAPPKVSPMLATAGELPVGDGWVYEVKWDGIRVLAIVGDGGVQLLTRTGNDITHRYPELAGLAEGLDAEDLPLVLDGEIVALDEWSRPSFHRLQARMNLNDPQRIEAAQHDVPIDLALFDVLVRGGVPMTDETYTERRAVLEALNFETDCVSVPRSYEDGQRLLRQMVERGFEGVVAKRADSTYRPGIRSSDWLKVKLKPRQEFVVGGWTLGLGRREGLLGALLLGFHESPGSPDLKYVGNVGSGFDDRDLAMLITRLAALERAQSPFDEPIATDGVRFAKPELVVEVEYQEMSPDGRLRHPVFKGLRTDKQADEVVLETDR